MRYPRTILLLVPLALTTACGARLTDEQREFALRDGSADLGGSGGLPVPVEEVDGLGPMAIEVEEVRAEGGEVDVAEPEPDPQQVDVGAQDAQPAPTEAAGSATRTTSVARPAPRTPARCRRAATGARPTSG